MSKRAEKISMSQGGAEEAERETREQYHIWTDVAPPPVTTRHGQ